MNIIRNALSEIQLKYKISRAVSEATNNSRLHIKVNDAEDVIHLAHDHPQYVLQAIYERLMYDGYVSSTTFLSIELLEHVVNNSSYSFHCVLADYGHLRNRLVELACIGGDNATCRSVKGAARRLVLEFSRMFADDDRLVLLSRLADRVEMQSGRKLLRSILLEKKRVHIRSPREGDFVMIDPIERPDGQGPRVVPSPIWNCQPCGFVNKSKHLRCIVCGSMKPRPQPRQQPQQQQAPPAATAAPATATVATAAVVAAPADASSSTASFSTAGSSSSHIDPNAALNADVVNDKTVDNFVVISKSPSNSSPAIISNSGASNSDKKTEKKDLAAEEPTPIAPTSSSDANITSPENDDEEDRETEAIVERTRSEEPLPHTEYVDAAGVHHLVEAEDAAAIKAVLHHNAEVEEAKARSRNNSVISSSSSQKEDVLEAVAAAADASSSAAAEEQSATTDDASTSASHAEVLAEVVDTTVASVVDVISAGKSVTEEEFEAAKAEEEANEKAAAAAKEAEEKAAAEAEAAAAKEAEEKAAAEAEAAAAEEAEEKAAAEAEAAAAKEAEEKAAAEAEADVTAEPEAEAEEVAADEE